jgi:hypothetical protein
MAKVLRTGKNVTIRTSDSGAQDMENESYLEPSNKPDLITMNDSQRGIRLGLFVTLYFDKGHTLVRQKAIANCFDDYWALYGSNLCWAMNSNAPYWYNLNKHRVMSPGEWLTEESEEGWEFKYHGGISADAASNISIQALGSSRWEADFGELSYIKAAIPIQSFPEQSTILLELTSKWCQRLCPVHGYGGIGILLPAAEFSWQEHYEPIIYKLAFQKPTIEVDYPITHSRFLSKGIKGVNWLTILDQKWLEAASGLEELQASTPELQSHDYGCGTILQAGRMPIYGDDMDNNLALYRKLAKVLRPLQVEEHDGVHSSGTNDTLNGPNFRKWLSRFD